MISVPALLAVGAVVAIFSTLHALRPVRATSPF